MQIMERMGRTIFCFAVVATLLTIALVCIARLPSPGRAQAQSTHKPLESHSPGMVEAKTMIIGLRP